MLDGFSHNCTSLTVSVDDLGNSWEFNDRSRLGLNFLDSNDFDDSVLLDCFDLLDLAFDLSDNLISGTFFLFNNFDTFNMLSDFVAINRLDVFNDSLDLRFFGFDKFKVVSFGHSLTILGGGLLI